jgi:Alpha-L-fucosidase
MKILRPIALIGAAMILTFCQKPYGPVPDAAQLKWHSLEYYMFCHFGPNTFTDKEWGEGDEQPDIFAPSALDCEQWAQVAEDAGMKGIIITAKHHDGFCLWPSSYSTHTVRESAWRDGNGDVLKELSEACKRHGLLFGVYLSPWDRNHPAYGTAEYNEIFESTIREVHSLYGPVFEQWFDGAGDGSQAQRGMPYDWPAFNEAVLGNSPDAVIFSDVGPGCRWVGNEDGYAGETNWCRINVDGFTPGWGAPSIEILNHGESEGASWVPAECDVSIRPGWFYHPAEDSLVKSVDKLMDIWLGSVGRGANLLLNVPPDRTGRINPADSARLMEFRAAREVFLGECVGRGNYRCGNESALATIKVKGGLADCIVLQEDISLGQRVVGFTVYAQMADGSWLNAASGTTIGHKRIIRLENPDGSPLETKQVRVSIDASKAAPRMLPAEIYKSKNNRNQ